MSIHVALLGQTDLADELLQGGDSPFSGFEATDTLVILGFIFILIIALFCWAYFVRRRPVEQHGAHVLVRNSRRSRHRSSRSKEKGRSGSSSDDSVRQQRVRRRRRKRSREDLPRNPTLGETGGLPPLRPDESDDSPPAESRV